MTRQTIFTPAKLNLFLAVRGRRPDGYHEIETLFVPLPQLTDRVTVTLCAGDDTILCCSGRDIAGPGENLCLRAAREFRSAAPDVGPWRIDLEKCIPVAAGLGGGSSDAAAVLRALNGMHGGVLSEARLRELARSVGADVSYFLQPVPAVGRGIGEQLCPVSRSCEVHVVLVNPGFPLATEWAYRNLDLAQLEQPSIDPLLRAFCAGDLVALGRSMFNAMEQVSCRKFPVLEMIMHELVQSGCMVSRLCGSGPTVFGVCRDAETARQAARHMREVFGECYWVWTGTAG